MSDKKQTRRQFMKTTVLAGAGLAFNHLRSAENISKPNIVVIFTDDLGYGDLACMGAGEMRTPNIDALFKNGMRFNNFYANCPVCSPSRAALLTGCYPDLVGVPGVIRKPDERSWGYLSEKAVLLPQVLKNAGYHTACIGKWHLGFESPNIPNDRGFDHFKGFLGGMMHNYWTHEEDGILWMRDNRKEFVPDHIHATELFTKWTEEYLDQRNKEQDPFFLYLAYNAPHAPVQPPEEWFEKVKKREKGISDKRAKFVAFVEHLDHYIGKVMDSIRDKGLLDNTLVVFTSDNGGGLRYGSDNGPLRGTKTNMYEGGIKVPCAFYWKDMIKPGSQTDNIAMLMDLFPTLCEIAGQSVNQPVEGISIVPTLKGKPQVTDERTLFWVRRDDNKTGGQAHYAARYKNYKLVQNTPFEEYQLFDLNTDPQEQQPLVREEHNKIFRRLRYELSQHIRRSGSVPWQKDR